MGVVSNKNNINELMLGIEALPQIMTSVSNMNIKIGAIENAIEPVSELTGLFTDETFSDNYSIESNSVAYKIGKLVVLDITLKKTAKWTPNVYVDLHIKAEMRPASPNQAIVFGKITDSSLIGTTGGDDCYIFINNNGTVRFNPYGEIAKEYLHFTAVYVTA